MSRQDKRFARGVAFNSILWPLGVGVALVVAFWPLMEEVYARVAWQRIPCHVSAVSAGGGQQFYFAFEGKKYYCSRLNLWPAKSADAHDTSVDDPPELDNGTCYVNGATPPTAVLNLDAYRHLELGIGQYIGAGMVLLATAVIAISGTRAKQRAAAAAAVPQAGNGGGA